jgi:hypothetical protein
MPIPNSVLSLKSASATNVVRVSVPADVYFNLDKIQKVQKDIFGRLGHLACYSGFDVRFDLERHFRVDEKLNVQGVPGFEGPGF